MSVFVQDYFQTAHALAQAGEDFVVVTWIRSEGHAPQDVGAKAIITTQGLHWGTVGGGKVEAKAIALGRERLKDRSAEKLQYLRWDLQKDVGMSCGGAVQLLFEHHYARAWTLTIFGAGHVAQALVRTLALLDCHVTCVDTREEWLQKLPQNQGHALKIVQVEDMARFAGDVPQDSYCILVTQGHATDVPILKRLLQQGPRPYLGVIGSRVKARSLRAELLRDGFADELIKTVHCPMGLPMGTHQPAEIAMSIVAQLLLVKNTGHTRLPEKA